jgi:hypothetical protein
MWKLEAENVCFSFLGACKIYANLWEGKNLVILNQPSMSGEGHGSSLGQVRVVSVVLELGGE